jgi:hypothetical protein
MRRQLVVLQLVAARFSVWGVHRLLALAQCAHHETKLRYTRLPGARTVSNLLIASVSDLFEQLSRLAGRLLSCLSSTKQAAARRLQQIFVSHTRRIVSFARLALILYSALALIVTLGVITNIVWKHGGVEKFDQTAAVDWRHADMREENHAAATWAADNVSVSR